MRQEKETHRDYRYERKFLVEALARRDLEAIIARNAAVFHEIYAQRRINNIYLDDAAFGNYFTSIDGVADRYKARIRWYGDSIGFAENPICEIKEKKGLSGNKWRFALNDFSLDQPRLGDTIFDAITESGMPTDLSNLLRSLKPVLLNRYQRKYYQSADKRFRLTLDWDIEFFEIKSRNNLFLRTWIDPTVSVVELKYDPVDDVDVDTITNGFPFRLSKSSKYVTGVKQLYP
jgi:SPX domain protein involved in polyphosphate accumulation